MPGRSTSFCNVERTSHEGSAAAHAERPLAAPPPEHAASESVRAGPSSSVQGAVRAASSANAAIAARISGCMAILDTSPYSASVRTENKGAMSDNIVTTFEVASTAGILSSVVPS